MRHARAASAFGRRTRCALALIALAALAGPLARQAKGAFFHAALLASDPKSGATLNASPERIRLLFSEQVEPSLSGIALVRDSGDAIRLTVTVDPHDVHALLAPTGLLAPGAYRVEWRVISADGHPVHGSYVFYVAVSAFAPPPPPPIDSIVLQGGAPSGPTVGGAALWPALLRGVAVGTLMALAGLLAFVAWGTPVPPASETGRPRRVAGWLCVAAPLLLAAQMAVWLAASHPTGIPMGRWAQAAVGTPVGRIQAGRLVLVLLALWALALARRPRLAALFALAAVLVGGAVGHPFAIHPLWAVPAKALHLLAGGLWLGGLIWLLLAEPEEPHYLAGARRVSSVALAAVVVIALSGILQTLLFLPDVSALVHSAYGTLVLIKIAGLVVLVLFGIRNRYRLLPAVRETGANPLRRSVRAEVVLLVLVILVGGLLSDVSPPHDHATAAQAALPTS